MDPHNIADAPPPRYAVESDDEDEYDPLTATGTSGQHPEVRVEFQSIYDIPSKMPLIFASGEAGVCWAKIARLGEQQAGICVNMLPVGLLFTPSWTNAIVIVSEAETRTRMPLLAMTTYTTTIIERLQPTSVAILDSYPTQMYVSPRTIPRENAPIRYLSVGERSVPDPELELFAPPNLLQSTTASLLNQLFIRSVSENLAPGATTIVLLPSLFVPPAPPATFEGRGVVGDFMDSKWDRMTLEKAHKWLLAIVGQGVDGSSLRDRTDSGVGTLSGGMTRSTLGEIGEGGMYI